MNPFWPDRIGSVAGAACAAHCLVSSVASAIGLGVLASEAVEWGFSTLAVGFAVVAAIHGYWCHRAAWVVAGFGAGVLVLLLGRLGEVLDLHESGVGLAVAGAGLWVASDLRGEVGIDRAPAALVLHPVAVSALGVSRDAAGCVAIDAMGRTSLGGVSAAGDATTRFQSAVAAMASGQLAAAGLCHDLTKEDWDLER
jgi:hypothetical protein